MEYWPAILSELLVLLSLLHYLITHFSFSNNISLIILYHSCPITYSSSAPLLSSFSTITFISTFQISPSLFHYLTFSITSLFGLSTTTSPIHSNRFPYIHWEISNYKISPHIRWIAIIFVFYLHLENHPTSIIFLFPFHFHLFSLRFSSFLSRMIRSVANSKLLSLLKARELSNITKNIAIRCLSAESKVAEDIKTPETTPETPVATPSKSKPVSPLLFVYFIIPFI